LDVVGGESPWFKDESDNGFPESRVKGKNVANNIDK